MYGNITALMISRNNPLYYCPQLFTYAIFRPIIFNIVENVIKYKQHLPGIVVTDETFVILRTEWLDYESRYMVSHWKCRSNTAVLPSDEIWSPISWKEWRNYSTTTCVILDTTTALLIIRRIIKIVRDITIRNIKYCGKGIIGHSDWLCSMIKCLLVFQWF